MHSNLIIADPSIDYGLKEAGPIIIALAFVIGVGGLAAAAILICGWQQVKSVALNVHQRRVEITCK